MMIGGAGAAAAAAGGGYLFFLRGPTGAKGVVDDFYSALETGDAETAAGLYHRDSRTGEQIAESGDPQEGLGWAHVDDFENLSVSVESLYELTHFLDPQDAWGASVSEDDDVNEIKRILAVVSFEWENRDTGTGADEADIEYSYDYEQHWVALDGSGDWKLWD